MRRFKLFQYLLTNFVDLFVCALAYIRERIVSAWSRGSWFSSYDKTPSPWQFQKGCSPVAALQALPHHHTRRHHCYTTVTFICPSLSTSSPFSLTFITCHSLSPCFVHCHSIYLVITISTYHHSHYQRYRMSSTDTIFHSLSSHFNHYYTIFYSLASHVNH